VRRLRWVSVRTVAVQRPLRRVSTEAPHTFRQRDEAEVRARPLREETKRNLSNRRQISPPMVRAQCGSKSRRTRKLGAQKKTYVVRAIWASPAKRLVPPRVQLAVLRASDHTKLSAYAARVETRRMCSKAACSDEVCERCHKHGHNDAQCPNPRGKACGRSGHRDAMRFECPEHKCSQCKGAMGPNGQRNTIRPTCPETLNTGRAYVEQKPKGKPVPRSNRIARKAARARVQHMRCDGPFCARMSIQSCPHTTVGIRNSCVRRSSLGRGRAWKRMERTTAEEDDLVVGAPALDDTHPLRPQRRIGRRRRRARRL
jgi:hypothetical protein